MNLQIITDSAADLLPEEREKHNVQVVPLTIHFPEGEIPSEAISPDSFYDRLKAMYPRIPTTSMPSPGQLGDLYRRAVEAGKHVLSLHLSSGLSGTFQAAEKARQLSAPDGVTCHDCGTLSGGQRFQVLAASMAARANWSLEAILKRLERIRAASEVVYTLETLEYLSRGGRIGRVQALAGALLNIKPIIRVDDDGRYSTVGKVRSMRKAVNSIVQHLQSLYADVPLWVSVMHGQISAQAEALAQRVEERLNVARLEVLRISPVLGVHTGPGIVGVAALPMHLMEDLA
ncbi:MAG: DegV family protein [Anaerolineae bacterium]|nr:MAG: DegV family protein [Anaerolineae bacterium]